MVHIARTKVKFAARYSSLATISARSDGAKFYGGERTGFLRRAVEQQQQSGHQQEEVSAALQLDMRLNFNRTNPF